MEKMKSFFRNLSLQKSMAVHVVVYVAIALFLGNLTAGICEWESRKISAKYDSRKEKYYLTNDKGEQLGEGAYIWSGYEVWSEEDEKMQDILNAIPVVMYPVYSALGVAAAAVLFYKNKLKRPLKLLTEAAERISGNDLDFQVIYPNKDEMGKLCSSFEVMRSALEKNQTEMWRLMEERKRLNRAFAHDLRTPLTVLKGYQEMIWLSGGEQEKKTAEIMAKHLLRMEKYVESMSSIRRLEDREISCKQVQIREFLAVLESTGAVFCQQKEKAFSFQSRVHAKCMELDGELILEVYHNLLSNAVRYAKTCVEVMAEEKEEGLLLTVLDDGNGFSQEALRMALEPYYHETQKGASHKQDTGREEHFGLGLYICKILCRQHGGCLKIENTHAGAAVTALFKKVDKK